MRVQIWRLHRQATVAAAADAVVVVAALHSRPSTPPVLPRSSTMFALRPSLLVLLLACAAHAAHLMPSYQGPDESPLQDSGPLVSFARVKRQDFIDDVPIVDDVPLDDVQAETKDPAEDKTGSGFKDKIKPTVLEKEYECICGECSTVLQSKPCFCMKKAICDKDYEYY